MAALIGKDYFCACTREQLCDETCPVYVARENHKDDVITSIAPVKHGKWEVLESFSSPFDDSHKDRCRCTNCGFIHVFTDYHFGQYNFCPQCGSKNGW